MLIKKKKKKGCFVFLTPALLSYINMLTLGLGQLFYVLLCFINAIAVLSEERFLARSKIV
jgi:hypothetical protein